MDATIRSLEDALESNLRLQNDLARRIKGIAERKASNRRLAARITSQIVSSWDEIDTLQTPPEPMIPKQRTKRRSKGTGREQSSSTSTAVTIDATKYPSSKWNYDPYRKWTRRYFVDPDGNIPAPNDDIVKRRKLEQGKFFYHTSPPWSKKEVKMLSSIVSEMKAAKTKDGNDHVDFDHVALALEKRMKREDKKNRPMTIRPRSGEDCRLKYADTQKQPPLSKEESMKILEQVHAHNGSPPWPDVAASVDRTAWQTLLTYRSKLTSSRALPFSPSDDELLLKCAAAMGPQWVLNRASVSDLTARFFPERSPKQVLGRLNNSLVNPNYARGVWSDEEERRLVLCMKVYRDTPVPLMGAAAHFPERASKSVTEKWEQSMNPEYSLKPFTPSEDQTLLEAVRESPEAGWAELARLFPSRHPRSLARRWNEVASPEDLVLKHGTSMKQAGGARRGLLKSDGLLSSDDFVVRVKRESDDD